MFFSFVRILLLGLILILPVLAYADNAGSPLRIAFYGAGLTVHSPAGVLQTELRIADPERIEIFRQGSSGEDIYWAPSGMETDGEYRYEAVVVTESSGKIQQNKTSGGFVVEGGVILVPPGKNDTE